MAEISILLPNLAGGGAERVNLSLAHEFVRAGHEVEFVLMQMRGELLGEAQTSFSVVDLAAVRARSVPRALVRYLQDSRPDALLAAMWPLTVIAPIAQLMSRHECRVVVSEHNTLSIQYGGWGGLHRTAMRASMAMAYRLAKNRVGVSAGVVRDIAALSGLRPGEFNCIHNPIPPRPDPPVSVLRNTEALWSCPAGARIVTVGSLKVQKNHRLLLRGFAQLDCSDARLMFVGDGPSREQLLSLAQELGVADRVIFAGFQPDPTPFYDTADLFVLSSDYEGFGNVIGEALARGMPVVSTDCPTGPAEILDGGRYGTLVPVGDASELALAMETSLATEPDREALIRRAGEFAPNIAAQRYLDLLGLT